MSIRKSKGHVTVEVVTSDGKPLGNDGIKLSFDQIDFLAELFSPLVKQRLIEKNLCEGTYYGKKI